VSWDSSQTVSEAIGSSPSPCQADTAAMTSNRVGCILAILAIAMVQTAQALNGDQPPSRTDMRSPTEVGEPLDDVTTEALYPRLAAIWGGQKADILTARLKFRFLTLDEQFIKSSVTRQQVFDTLATLDLASTPDQLKVLSTLVANERGARDLKWYPWTETEFVSEGDRRRETNPDLTQIRDARTLVLAQPYIGNKGAAHQYAATQFNIYDSGAPYRVLSLNEFRYVPSADYATRFLKLHRKPLRLLSRPHLVSIATQPQKPTSPRTEWVIDPTNGACINVIGRDPHGNVAYDIIQGGFSSDSHGILFPRYRVDIHYAGTRIREFEAKVLIDATFNSTIPEDAFRLPAKKRDLVANHIGLPPGEFVSFEVSTPVDDARDAHAKDPTPRVPPTSRAGLSVFIIGNVAILSLAAGWFIYRRRRDRGRR
jgi:hypothetical protein